jgi:hypothetical protein
MRVPALAPYRYRMVAAPLLVDDPSMVYQSLRGRFGESSLSSWRMGWWDPAAQLYVPIDAAHPRGFESGNAYWLAFAAPQEPWSLSGRSNLPAGGSDQFARTLEPGWNMVGNPAAYPVSLVPNQLWIDDRDTVLRFDQARDQAPPLVGEIYVYDPALTPDDVFYPYQVRPSSLAAWGGCWVENRTDHAITLLIPALEADLMGGLATPTSFGVPSGSGPLDGVAWAFPIRARASESPGRSAEQAAIVLAVDPAARAGDDRFDLGLPPSAPGARIHLALLADETEGDEPGRDGPRLLLDARRDPDPVWHLAVESDAGVDLTWGDPHRPDSPEWTLLLRDPGTGREWDLRALRSVPLAPGRHRLEILGRSAPLPPGVVENLTLAIEPNPFRESTMFHFALPAAARAALAVFTASGHRVWELPEEELSAGEHAVAWSGRDASGSRVPAGAYFVRLRAGGAERTERFVLLK